MKINLYLIIAIVVLFVSSFPMAIGWFQLGTYIPRFVLLLISLLYFPFVIETRQFLFLCLYYLYIVFANIAVGQPIEYLSISANFMEMAIPMLVMTILIYAKNSKHYHVIGIFCLLMTFTTLFTSMYVLSYVDNNAIRAMVGMTARGESTAIYLKMGVADYSTAAMVMAMPCVLIALFKHTHKNAVKICCIFGTITVLWFMYIASVTTTFFICIIISIGSLLVNDKKSMKVNFIKLFPILLLLLILFPLFLDYFSNSYNEEISIRSAMLKNMWNDLTYDDSGDLGNRIGLYKMSLDAFAKNPFLGNASALVGGHNYIIDRLGLYGLLGTAIHLIFVIYQCKLCYKIVPPNYKVYYLIILLGLLTLAFLKNLSGFSYWTFTFLYYPCIFALGTKTKFFIINKK